MQKISALLITYNEEKYIKDYLENIDYADEVIIVDSFSTDRTTEIAKQFPHVKILKKEFKDFSSQRNFALKNATHEWITFFDADEFVPNQLKKEILETINDSNALDAYYVHRNFYFKKKLIKYSGIKNDKAIRLFKKSKCHYEEELLVHEQIVCDGQIGELKNKLDHFSLSSVDEFRKKLTKYSKLRAEELYIKKLKPNFTHFYLKPFYRFMKHYVFGLGFLDGKEGMLIARLHAYSVHQRYKFLNDMYKQN